jgi:hypothetical protein
MKLFSAPETAPDSVRQALKLGWVTVAAVLLMKFWPYWTNAVAALPSDTNWLARFIATIVVSIVVLFTPLFIGQVVTAVSLVLLARRHRWARLLFLAGALLSIMLAIASKAGKVVLVSNLSFYTQLLLLLVETLVALILFAGSADDWFRRKIP